MARCKGRPDAYGDGTHSGRFEVNRMRCVESRAVLFLLTVALGYRVAPRFSSTARLGCFRVWKGVVHFALERSNQDPAERGAASGNPQKQLLGFLQAADQRLWGLGQKTIALIKAFTAGLVGTECIRVPGRAAATAAAPEGFITLGTTNTL